MARARRLGEFELIARYFAPLARDFEGAGGLQSDNAFLPADARHDLVVKTDTVVAGVHFLADDLPGRIAAKALRVRLSDLAAGGATPFVYQLSLALPSNWREAWVSAFAKGLAAEAGRDIASLPVSVWGAPEDGDRLNRLRDAGVARVIITFKSAPEADLLGKMDRWAELIRKLNQ